MKSFEPSNQGQNNELTTDNRLIWNHSRNCCCRLYRIPLGRAGSLYLPHSGEIKLNDSRARSKTVSRSTSSSSSSSVHRAEPERGAKMQGVLVAQGMILVYRQTVGWRHLPEEPSVDRLPTRGCRDRRGRSPRRRTTNDLAKLQPSIVF